MSITATDIQEMVERIDARFYPIARYEFEPFESVYRIGDYGYVTLDEWRKAFEDEPDWAETVYMLDGNQPGCAARWAELYAQGGTEALDSELDEMFNADAADEVFYTEATEDGTV